MDKSEYAENNVNAREIIANVLDALGMNAPSFSKATGIAYQRIFDLQRGRTKKFNPGVVNMICKAFPQINKNYLYTGEGEVITSGVPADLIADPNISSHNASGVMAKAMSLMQQVMEKDRKLDEKSSALAKRELDLAHKELELAQREANLIRKEAELGITKEKAAV